MDVDSFAELVAKLEVARAEYQRAHAAQRDASVFDAVYRLDAYHDANLKRRCPGFVIEHSCGLSLVHPSDSDELGGDDSDIRQNWRITHTGSGLGFGLTLNFKRATDGYSSPHPFQSIGLWTPIRSN
jgi:hypothetical protein